MYRKKLFSLLLAAILLLSACSGAAELPPELTEQPSESIVSTESKEAPGEAVEESSSAAETAATSEEETLPEQTDAPAGQSTEVPTEAPSEAISIVDAAYALAPGEYLSGVQTLSGYVDSIKTPYSSHYGNITLVLTVPGYARQPILCYRLEGQGVEDLAPGDWITVSGRLTNYKGTIEFDAGCYLTNYTGNNPTEPEESESGTVWNDDSRDYVASYIHTYGRLPDYYVTKNQASNLYGWSGGSLDQYAPGMCIGGDRFGNYEGQLPDAPGRYWTECDIGTIGTTSRGAQRIVFSNDGLIYYTSDHYGSFTLLYGEP